MDSLFIIIRILCLVASLQRTVVNANPLCHVMEVAMNQYCSAANQDADTRQQIQAAEGPRGKAGPRGPPGKVNYTLIDENIKERYRDLEERIENKTERRLELRIQQLEAKLLDHQTKLPGEQTRFIKECEEATSWNGTGGIFNIYPDNPQQSIQVYCDLTSDGGGWTVFQRRMDGSVDFYRGWDDYVNGFGEKDKEFWLGLETIYQLTKNGNYELRVDIGLSIGITRYAQYGRFSIAGSDDNYRLTVGDHSGTAGAALTNGQQFTTKDRDNDEWRGRNCAVLWTGAWWYRDCGYSNLNGLYHHGPPEVSVKNIWWLRRRSTMNFSYKFTEMKFRKKHN